MFEFGEGTTEINIYDNDVPYFISFALQTNILFPS
jgi:hypothetical protein